MVQSDITWLLILAIVVISIIWLWSKQSRSYSKYNIPPFPVKPWPVFGHFLMLRGNLRDKMKDWKNMAGNIHSLDIGGQLHIQVHDYNAIREIMTKHADNIPNALFNFANNLIGEHNKGIFAARDDNWKDQRTTSLNILRYFGMGKNIMAEKIQEEVTSVLDDLTALKGRPANVRLLLNAGIANVICSVAVGKRFNYEDPMFASLMTNLMIILRYVRYVGLITPFKFLMYIPGDLFHVKKWVKSSTYINENFCKFYIKEIQKTLNENEEPENFVAAYLKEMKKMDNKGGKNNLSEDNLIAIVRTLFIAGTETTSTTILWCLLFMLYYPEVQEKVYQEIELNVGTARIPNISDRPKLTYLNAVIMETQRKASLVPLGTFREVKNSFEACGFIFPKDSTIWPVLDSVHCDTKIWGDPENFRPERFIDDNGALMSREELIPFNIGRRSCLGEALAKMELFLFLSAMFQRFRFEPADKLEALPSLKEIYGTTLVPQPYQIRFVLRK